MCHIPIMHETMETSIEKSKDVLNHIHLGNGVVKDTTDKYYGDKHPSWNYPAGEYSDADGEKFIRILREIGYTDKDNATISFEMRPFCAYFASSYMAAAMIWAFFTRLSMEMYSSALCSRISSPGKMGPQARMLGMALA